MRYFKIMRGFGENDFIPIDETEIEKAIYAQIVGNMVVTLKNGSIVGNHISAIVPDFHRMMGWNYGHRLGADDYDDINRKGVHKKYDGIIGSTKEKVAYLMKTNQQHLIGSNVDIQRIEPPKQESVIDTSILAQVKKIL